MTLKDTSGNAGPLAAEAIPLKREAARFSAAS